MQIHQLDVRDVFNSLNSSSEGLSSIEAERRLQEYGENHIQRVQRLSPWLRFFHELTHFFAAILWIAAALAFIAEFASPGEGMAKIGYAIVMVIIISALFSFWQEYRVEKSLTALQKLLPANVKVLRDHLVAALPIESLVPGDVILLEQGDNVPADVRLIEAFALRVNNSTITGESHPQRRNAEVSTSDNVLSARNILLAGTVVVAGQGKAVVFATAMRTEFGKIAHLTQSSGEQVSPLSREISHVSYLIAMVAIILGLLFFIIGRFLHVPLWQDVIFAIGIIVAMVPEGFQPTLTLSLVLAAQRMVKRNVLIRHLPAIEALGSTTVICTDKTGTLTQNRMTVEEVMLGLSVHSMIDIDASSSLLKKNQEFFQCASLCHDLHLSHDNIRMGDPMEVALYQMVEQLLPHLVSGTRLHTIPFDTERMRLSVVYQMQNEFILYCKGAPEKVLPLSSHIFIEGNNIIFDENHKQQIIKTQIRMAEKGLRVLALAYKPLLTASVNGIDENGLVFCGLVGLDDPPRTEVPAAIQKCYEAGIRIIMITGDHPRTAVAIAKKIKLVRDDNTLVITGDQLRHLSPTQLQLALDAPHIIFARVVAEQKMLIVEALKKKKQIIAVTGDGVNDAPALKAAHIGIAMGIAGTDVARAAADIVLLDDHFASIINGIEEGRAVFANIRKFLTYVLAHNVPELIPYLAFVLFKIPLALTPLQILVIDMGTDSLTALGLGVEKADSEIMRQPPRPLNERLLNSTLALRAYCFLGLIEATVAMAAFFFVLHRGGWQYGQVAALPHPLYLQATTACLSTIIIMQMMNVYLCRSTEQSIFSMGIFGNTLISWGVLLEIIFILLINYTAIGNFLLNTAPLDFSIWLFILPFPLAMLMLEELRKYWIRHK